MAVTTDAWAGLQGGPRTVEVWHPAAESHRGGDLDPATQDRFAAVWAAEGQPAADQGQAAVRDAEAAPGRFPLVLLSHGLAGYRREATFVATHLASHGYVIVAADHRHSTSSEVDAFIGAGDDRRAMPDLLARIADARILEVPFLIEQALGRLPIDAVAGVGLTGASFGGWTSLVAPGLDRRVRAIVPMCPGGGSSPVHGPDRRLTAAFETHLRSWPPDVACLMLVADHDSWLPLYGQIETFGKLTVVPRRMVILKNANHNHFVDEIEIGHEWMRGFTAELAERFPEERWACIAADIAPFHEMLAAEPAYAACRGLAVAHFDAALKDLGAAHAFWAERDIRDTLADVGVPAELIERVASF